MQELYERLSTDERRVLNMYHERGNWNIVNQSEAKLLLQEKEGTYQFIMPVKVLQTTVYYICVQWKLWGDWKKIEL